MTLMFASGTSVMDYVRQWGWYWTLHLAVRRPDLMWQMFGVGLIRMFLGSRNIHVVYGSGGKLVDRRFQEVRMVKASLASRRQDLMWIVTLPDRGKITIDESPVKYPRLWQATIGFFVLWLSRGRVRMFLPEDCVTCCKRTLRSAGWEVPDRIWTPDHLLDHIRSIPQCRLRRCR